MRGSTRHSVYEQRGQAQERSRVFVSSGDLGGHVVANHLTGLRDSFASEPEHGMVAHGQREQFIYKVFEEVVAAKMGEFMRDRGVELSLRQADRHACG